MNEQDDSKGPKYFVDVEDVVHPWDGPTITVPQIRELAGWDSNEQVIEVDLEKGTERTLPDDAVVELTPGQGFAKKIKFKRGR
jgi:hypothetical protein